jgi:hypothetical protein
MGLNGVFERFLDVFDPKVHQIKHFCNRFSPKPGGTPTLSPKIQGGPHHRSKQGGGRGGQAQSTSDKGWEGSPISRRKGGGVYPYFELGERKKVV